MRWRSKSFSAARFRRAREYLRVLACELNRIASHLVATGAMAMDIGAFTPFLHWLREREYINDIMEALCGSRLTYNYMRIGGVSQDLPDGMADKILRWLDHFEPIIDEFDRLISNNEIFVKRLANVAAIRAEDAAGFRPRRAEPARQRCGLGPAARPAVLGLRGLPVRRSARPGVPRDRRRLL